MGSVDRLAGEMKPVIVKPKKTSPMDRGAVLDAISKIGQFMKPESTLVVINDAHRSTPSKEILEVMDELGIPYEAIAIATGSHAPPTENELRNLLPTSALETKNLIIHEGNQAIENYTYYGITSRGTPIFMNKIIEKYKQILCINSVEPHYFAGFTGGVKSLIPGLASVKTIEKNHSWALSPLSLPTVTVSNPLFEDLWEAFGLLCVENVLGIQLISTASEIYHISVGNLKGSFEQATEIAKKVFTTSFSEKFDLVIAKVEGAIARSLYQAQKGLENTRQALKEGGTIVLLAECHEGIGNKAFYQTLSKFKDPAEVVSSLSIEKYRFGDHKASKFASLSLSGKLYVVSQGLTEEEVENVFATKITETQLEGMIHNHLQDGERVLIVEDAGNLVVYVRES